MITYNRISKILYKSKVNSPQEAFALSEIKELEKENPSAIKLAVDYYFNNDNYDTYYDINREVEKLNH
ncbi:MAG: hypothetical protein JNL75_06040 [Chitinophagales bacterium]|nr:hypothetical protein [Chitinophagales bacterium]